MAKTIGFACILLILIACKKDKVPAPCSGVSMTGDREIFVGKWRWYKTVVEEWYDIGPSNYFDYTPQNQGFEYYFTISHDGILKMYRNDTLINEYILNNVKYENFGGVNTSGMKFNINCSANLIEVFKYSSNVTNDTILSPDFPLDFIDEENHLKSIQNHFVRD